MRYEIKCFIKPHPDYGYDNCEDRIAINTNAKRFAVADGMTESYLSHLFADIITKRYVAEGFSGGDPDTFVTNLINGDEWKEKAHKEEKRIENTIYYNRLLRKKRICDYAASTFVGVTIKDNELYYLVIGDSCLFITDDNFKLKEVYPDLVKEGFNNHPSCVTSNGEIRGEIISGEISIQSGYIFLLTDKISKWFLEHVEDNYCSGNRIWDFASHDEMFKILQEEYESRNLEGDDVAIIAIHVIDEEEVKVLHHDIIDELISHNTNKGNADLNSELCDKPEGGSNYIGSEEKQDHPAKMKNDNDTLSYNHTDDTTYPSSIPSEYSELVEVNNDNSMSSVDTDVPDSSESFMP